MDLFWSSIKLCNETLESLKDLQFVKMTPVQASCIPLFLENKDVSVEAVTGSGKTLCFVIPIVEKLFNLLSSFKKKDVLAIILTPTRELANQISKVFDIFLKHFKCFTKMLLVGGVTLENNLVTFDEFGGNIIIATPGRFLEMLNTSQNMKLAVKALEILILDEADRLLELGFATEIGSILPYLPKQRRTGLFSATQTKQVGDLIRAGLRNPVQIKISEKNSTDNSPQNLSNYYCLVKANKKFEYLIALLKLHYKRKILVFFSTCAETDYFFDISKILLPKHNILSLHGKKSNRSKPFDEFGEMKSAVMFCTDVLARGVDIPKIDWVIQFDPPTKATSYIHRSGRTARIGNFGSSLIFLMDNEEPFVNFLKINQNVELMQLDNIGYSTTTNSLLEKIRKFSIKDRSLYEKGIKAFVSFINAYSKNDCNLIFNVKELDFGGLATTFGLLHLPSMPELRNKSINCSNFIPIVMNYNEISFKDKKRESARQLKLKEGNIKIKLKKEKRLLKRINKEKKVMTKVERKKHMKIKRKLNKKQISNNISLPQDEEELESDFKFVKKLKKGKLSLKQFDKAFNID